MWRFIWSNLLFLGSFLLPLSSGACPVCYQANNNGLWAYYGITIVMTLIPFTLLFFLGWWIYRNWL